MLKSIKKIYQYYIKRNRVSPRILNKKMEWVGENVIVERPVRFGEESRRIRIGEKVCVLSGVTIGRKSIIGAGSVVTKDIPVYCIAEGNPARVIKKYSFKNHRWETVK